MQLLYSFSIKAYGLLLWIASSLGISKAKLWIDGRKNWQEKLSNINSDHRKLIWVHTASLGEFEQARPLIESLKQEHDKYFILLSFFSPSGYEIRHNYKHADLVCYLPLDTQTNAKQFLQLVQPDLAIFVKYEFWINYLNQLKKNNIPTLLISGIFRKKQHFFKWYAHFFRNGLQAFHHFFVQNKVSEQLLHSIHFNNTSVVGDTRLDQVIQISKEEFQHETLDQFCGTNPVIIFGSSWEQEHQFANQLAQQYPELKIIIAPHEVEAQKMRALKNTFENKAILWSEVQGKTIETQQHVLIIDQIGLLSKIYRYSKIAVIGGGFGSGIHNTLEAAVYGIPVVFGPKHQKFQEALDLIQCNAAFSMSNYKEFEEITLQLLKDKRFYENSASAANTYVHEHAGATKAILHFISNS